MKITRRQLRRIIKEGFLDTLKSAVGLGKNEQEMLLDIQKGFEQIADGINNMVALGKAGSRMKSKKGDLLGDARDGLPALMPDDAWNPKGTGLMNIFTAIKNLDGTALGSIDLAGVAPDAAEEMNKLFGDLQQSAGPRVKSSLLRKIGGLGSKILDEYNEFGPDDDGAGLEAFYDVFQDAVESEVRMAWTPEFWWETYGDEISELSEGKIKITRRQLRKIIKEVTGGKGWKFDGVRCNSHNISQDEAYEAIAILQEFNYELGLPPTVDSNNIAIDDALAAYPGEYTYEDFRCAIGVVQGRGG